MFVRKQTENNEIMKTYKILDHLEEVVKTLTVKSVQEVKDAIYDLRDYHGFMMQYTYEEVK